MAIGGRRKTNTHLRDWGDWLDVIWARRPDLRANLKELHAAAARHFKGAIGSQYDFEGKVRGGRATDEHFSRMLFVAAGLDREGLSLEAWQGSIEAWSAAVDSLRETRLKDELDLLASQSPLGVRLSSRPFPPVIPDLTVRRAESRKPGDMVRVGEEICLSLRYSGDMALRSVHLLLVEYLAEDHDWQVFSLLPDCTIKLGSPVTLLPNDGALGLEAGLGLSASHRAPDYSLFAFLSPSSFDHRALARLQQLDPEQALVGQNEMAEISDLLLSHADVLVGRARYQIC